MNDKVLLRDPLVLERLSSVTGVPQISIVRHPLPHEVAFDESDRDHFVVILVGDLTKPVLNAISYARLLAGETLAIHIRINPSDKRRIEDRWKNLGIDVPLVVLDSADGSIIQPLTEFMNGIRQRHERSLFTFLVPVLSGLKWWQRFLHNQTARLIERAFEGEEGVVTTRLPFSLTNNMSETRQLHPE